MKRILGYAAAFAMLGGMAAAQSAVEGLVAGLESQGFHAIEVQIGRTQSKVEAIRGTTKAEVVVDNASGRTLKSETEIASAEERHQERHHGRHGRDGEDDDGNDRNGDRHGGGHGSDDHGAHGSDDHGHGSGGHGSDDHDDDHDDDNGGHGGHGGSGGGNGGSGGGDDGDSDGGDDD